MPKELAVEENERGFSVISFVDDYGLQCSLQKSSSAEAEKIWLGVDEPQLKYLVKGEGWKDFILPEGVEAFGWMHLTQDQVKALLPHLQRFAETGEL